MMRNQSKVRAVPVGEAKAARPAAAKERAQAPKASMGHVIRRAHQAFTRSLEARLEPYGISSSMYFFLRLLWERDGQTQREISAELGLTPPTTVSAMDNLEGKGLIVRSRNAHDRRKINIYLTKRGRELESKLRPNGTGSRLA